MIWLFLIVFLLISAGMIGLVISELWRVIFLNGMPAVSSTWAIVDRVIVERVLPTKGLILDLGCGSGWTLRRFFRSGIRGPLMGYEKEFSPWLIGKIWNFLTMSPVKIHRTDYLAAPIEQAAGIYLFLLPQVMSQMSLVLASRARPDAVIVCAEFSLPDWRPIAVFEARGVTKRRSKIYIYKPVDSLPK